MTGFIYFILSSLLGLLMLAILIKAVLSWLFAFGVIDRRNNAARSMDDFLGAVTAPVLRPLQRIIPPLGGIDITPILALLILQGVQGYLLPYIFLLKPYIG